MAVFIRSLILTVAALALLLDSTVGAPNSPEAEQNVSLTTSPPPKLNNEETRIIGGVAAEPKEFPHQIHLFSRIGSSYGSCGGSIIGKKWILTAAHCVQASFSRSRLSFTLPAESFVVKFGSVDYWGSGGSQETTVEKVIVHPKYGKKGIFSYDFALLKVHDKFTFDEFTQPIALASENYSPTGDAILSGWGGTEVADQSPSAFFLQKTTLPLIKDAECSETLGPLSSFFLQESMLCAAGGPKSASGACSGDSGGPLTQKHGKKNVLVGIVSWGHKRCELAVPTIFARVSAARKWIKKETLI